METFVRVFLMNWERAFYGYLIVVSAIIVLMGIIKKTAFNKIKNKLLRKFLLAFTSILLVLPFTALYFVGADINFKYYWIGCGMNAIALIVTYWFYENTILRDLIDKVGSLTLGRFFGFVVGKLRSNKKSANEIEEFQDVTSKLNEDVRTIEPISITTQKIPMTAITTANNKTTAAEKKEQEKLKNL